MLMRAQLLGPNRHVVSAERYNQIFSMHATTMIFLFAMPMLGGGLANYLIPLMIGAKDMAFPRLNALSYWLFAFGGLLLFSSFIFGGGGLDTGWYSYSPLTAVAFSPHDGVTFWTISIVMIGASSVLGAVNFIVTMLKLRAPGMTFFRMPLFALATYINSFLILYAIPSLTAALIMLYLDRKHGTVFFDATKGGDPVIWGHLFWFFGHPEVYVLILPAFGILSEVTPVFSRKPLFGRNSMILMIGIIGLLSFGVWGHHMFTFGLPNSFDVAMAATSMLIAVPTGVKIFNWLATMWGGSLQFKTPLLYVCGFIGFFVIGGLTGVMLASFPFDWQANGTYFLVGHLHNVLVRRHALRHLRRPLLLVPQDDRPLPERPPRQAAVLDHPPGCAAHLPAHVRPGAAGHAAPRLHLRSQPRLGRPQPDLLHRRLSHRRRHTGLRLQSGAQPATRASGHPTTRGTPGRSSGLPLLLRRRPTSSLCRRSPASDRCGTWRIPR